MLRRLIRILPLLGALLLSAVAFLSLPSAGVLPTNVTNQPQLTPTSPVASLTPALSRPTPPPSPAPATSTPAPVVEPPRVQDIPLPSRHLLSPMSHAYQTWNNCGPVTAMMVLSYYGVSVTQAEAATVLKTHPQDKNVSPGEMVAYLASFGLEGRTLINGHLDVIKRLLAQGIPVVLHHRLSLHEDYGHYTVARGYDDGQGVLIINDSYYGPMRRVAYSEVEQLWDYFNRRYIVVYRPQDRPKVETILGADADEPLMLRRALAANQARINAAPNSATAWLNLAETHFLLGDDATAIAAWEKAQVLGLSSRVLWYASWPATAYNRLGLPEQVLALTQRVIVEQPASPDLYYERGLAYLALGDRVRARQALNQALVYDPGMGKARKVLEELGRG